MTSRQFAGVSVLFNGEPPWAVRALKVFETVDWYPRSPSGELEEASFLLWGPRTKNLPEPGDDLVFFIITAIVGELGPIVPKEEKKKHELKGKKEPKRLGYDAHIDIGHSADQEFQLPLIEDGDEVLRNDLEETVDERGELFLDAANDPIVNGEIDVFVLVLFGHWYTGASGLEVDGDKFTEPVLGDRESFFQDVGDIVLTRELSAQVGVIEGKKSGTYSIQVKPLWSASSTPWRSAMETFLPRIIL